MSKYDIRTLKIEDLLKILILNHEKNIMLKLLKITKNRHCTCRNDTNSLWTHKNDQNRLWLFYSKLYFKNNLFFLPDMLFILIKVLISLINLIQAQK